MPRHHMIDNVKVSFTPEEETARDIEEQEEIAKQPMNDWKYKMAMTDGGMPRFLEDHIKDDHDGVAGNEFLQAKFDGKKALRATKP